MIDLNPAFTEASNNIRTWRNRYTSQEYPHKILVNIMYRAYIMNFIWNDYKANRLPVFDNFQDSVRFLEQYYGKTALEKVNANLLTWLQRNADDWVGNCCYRVMDEMCTSAERNRRDLTDVESSYYLHLLNDKLVLYWIAMRQAGNSEAKSIELLTNYQVEITQELEYRSLKQAFSELISTNFLSERGIQTW